MQKVLLSLTQKNSRVQYHRLVQILQPLNYNKYPMAQEQKQNQGQGQGQQVKAKWGLEANWQQEGDEIVITVSEEISGKKWKVCLGKDAYNNPREAYDKIRPVIDGGAMEIVGGMPEEDSKPLCVKITKGYEAYEWNLKKEE